MKLFSILKKDLLILLRDRTEMLVLFLMPLAFIIPISFALGSGDGYGISRSNQMERLPVVDYDQGPRAQALLNSVGESMKLEKDYGLDLIQELELQEDPDCAPAAKAETVDNPICVEKVGRAMLQRSWRPTLLIIPKDFSKLINTDKQVKVTLLYDPAGDPIKMQQIQGVIKGATIKMSVQNQVESGIGQMNDLAAFAPEALRESVKNQTSQPRSTNQRPAFSLQKVNPSSYQVKQTPDTYQQTIPGYAVMYVFFIATSMIGSIRQERLTGTFRRLLGAPVDRAELLSGKLLATLVIGLAQVFILFGVGVLLFKLQLGKDPLAFFLLTLALVSTAAAMGLAVSTTRLRGGMLGAPLIIFALLGGCMFPLDLMPSFMRSLSYLVPHSWALTGYQNLMVRGQGLQQVFPQIAVLVGFALFFFLIAIRRFNFQNQEVE